MESEFGRKMYVLVLKPEQDEWLLVGDECKKKNMIENILSFSVHLSLSTSSLLLRRAAVLPV